MRLTSEPLSKERHTITEIGTAAFDTCGLRTLALSSGVRYIQQDAIIMCEQLETIVLPEGMESLENASIIQCPNLKRVVIPASVTYIHDDNVYECGDAAVVTPWDSYAWKWATGWASPCRSRTDGRKD